VREDVNHRPSSIPKVVPFFLPNAGCTSRCIYCDQSVAAGSAPVNPTPQEIETCLREAASRSGAAVEAAFFGATFTGLLRADQERLLAPMARLKCEGIAARVRVSTHPGHVDEGTLDFLKEQMVDTLELGVQSFSDRVLAAAGRRITGSQVEASCRRIQNAGLGLVVQLMPFLPESTEEDDVDSAERTAALRPSAVRIFPTLVLRGTPLARLMETGGYRPASVVETVDRVAGMLQPLLARSVHVLRIGLQPSVRLSESVVAGPYHPALGELCRAAWLVEAIAGAVGAKSDDDCDADIDADGKRRERTGEGEGRHPVLSVPRELASLLLGHGGFGVSRLRRKTGMGWNVQVEKRHEAEGPTVRIGDNLVLRDYTAGVRVEREQT